MEEAEALGLAPTEKDDFCQMAQVVLVIGGDGTMLRAARTVYGREIAILGINRFLKILIINPTVFTASIVLFS